MRRVQDELKKSISGIQRLAFHDPHESCACQAAAAGTCRHRLRHRESGKGRRKGEEVHSIPSSDTNGEQSRTPLLYVHLLCFFVPSQQTPDLLDSKAIESLQSVTEGPQRHDRYCHVQRLGQSRLRYLGRLLSATFWVPACMLPLDHVAKDEGPALRVRKLEALAFVLPLFQLNATEGLPGFKGIVDFLQVCKVFDQQPPEFLGGVYGNIFSMWILYGRTKCI
mmetsp:Transcript_68558/g.121109  ORF Transcript_68558/g.121109 Transcript_68558/m.121109 type:complete len:223 (+) Transcript_68558:19-687(+)